MCLDAASASVLWCLLILYHGYTLFVHLSVVVFSSKAILCPAECNGMIILGLPAGTPLLSLRSTQLVFINFTLYESGFVVQSPS